MLTLLGLGGCGESWTFSAPTKDLADDTGGPEGVDPDDLDGDEHRSLTSGGDDCWDDPASIPVGYTAVTGRDQPAAADVHPDAADTWYDGVDQDCAGDDDFDQDGDGFRSSAWPDGGGAYGDDCYDAVEDDYPTSATCAGETVSLSPDDVHPDAADAWYDGTDADCAGDDDFDQDGDGYASCLECDDADTTVNPGAVEVCDDGIDNDCDGGSGGCRPTSAGLSSAVEYAGDDAFGQAGFAVSSAGDVDGDGYADLLIGANENDAGGYNAGAAYLVLGSTTPASASLSSAVRYTGEAPSDYAGMSVSGAGDVNGDGYDDLLVGAYTNDDGGDLAGAAYLVLGSAAPGSVSLSSAVRYTGEAPIDYAGISVSGAGDVNGDGYDDLLVGAYSNDDGGSNAGAAYLLLGSAAPASASLSAAVQYTGEAADYAGYDVAGAGDVDGDGYDDFLVGVYGSRDEYEGAAYLVLGIADPVSASLSGAVQYAGEASNHYAGISVAGAGDVDGDGYDDLLVGAVGNDDLGFFAGAAYLVLGSTTPASASLSTAVQYTGETSNDYAGHAVAGAGDVDGDGHDDLLVGAHYNDDGGDYAGAAYLVFGSTAPASASLSTEVQYTGESSNDYAGYAVAGADDVDGDGYDDLVVGASYNGDGGSYAGAAYLILGSGL